MSDWVDDFFWYVSGEKRLQSGLLLDGDQVPDLESLARCVQIYRDEGLRATTLARRLSSLRHFVKFRSFRNPEWAELLPEIPVITESESFPKALSVDDIGLLLNFDSGIDARLIRDRALLEVMYAAGLRVSEIVDLRVTDLVERSQWIRVRGKGNKERLTPVTERAWNFLIQYRDRVRPEWAQLAFPKFRDFLFLSPRRRPLTRMAVWKILRKRGLQVGIEGLHPHIFRHSFATHLLQGGADVRFVQALLGHAGLATTERYLKIADDELAQVFQKFHPLVS
jgi:integrase/recombinase XerD